MYSFAMICYELFEGSKPFGQMDAMSAARAASLFDRRPSWGKLNRRARNPARRLSVLCQRLVHTPMGIAAVCSRLKPLTHTQTCPITPRQSCPR